MAIRKALFSILLGALLIPCTLSHAETYDVLKLPAAPSKLAAKAPKVFGTNYYIRGADGEYLNGKLDKSVWVKWMELRVHGEAGSIKTPTGCIPRGLFAPLP